MAINDHKDIEEKDSHFPYAELDKHSKKLRQSAFDLAESLSEIEPRSNDINLVIQALTKVNTDDIKVMDRALNNFKKALAGMVMRSNESSIFGPNVTEAQMPMLMDRYTSFITETIALSERAMELKDIP